MFLWHGFLSNAHLCPGNRGCKIYFEKLQVIFERAYAILANKFKYAFTLKFLYALYANFNVLHIGASKFKVEWTIVIVETIDNMV